MDVEQVESMLRQEGQRRAAGNTQAFLARHAPFNKMAPTALQLFAEKAHIAFYPAGSVIVGPESGNVRFFYLIESGKVQARQAGEVTVTEYSILSLGVGECFPIGAVTAGRPSTNIYTAVEDSFCYQLPAEHYLTLMATSPEFNLFCTQYIASLLDQSRRQLQAQFAQKASEQQTLNSPLAGIGARNPVSVLPDTPLRAALEAMSQLGIGSMVVADAAKKPVGIFTRSDLLDRVVLADLPLTAPISQAMSASPFTLNEHATAYDAMLAMATHGIRHVLVTDHAGCLSGVVSERDLFALQRVGLRQIRQAIESAPSVEALKASAADVRQLSFNMLAQGIGAEQLTQFISALNDVDVCSNPAQHPGWRNTVDRRLGNRRRIDVRLRELGCRSAGIGEVHRAPLIHHEVVRSPETLALVTFGQSPGSLRGVDHANPGIRHLNGDQITIGRKTQAIGAVGVLEKGGHTTVRRDAGNPLVLCFGEQQTAVVQAHRAFSALEPFLDELDRRTGCDHARDRRRLLRGIQSIRSRRHPDQAKGDTQYFVSES